MSAAWTDAALAVLLGGMLGAGAWAMLAAMPRWSAPSLMRRVAPYVRDITDPAGTSLPDRFSPDPGSGLLRAGKHLLSAARKRAAGLFGSAEATNARLAAAGWRIDAEHFRARQLGIAVAAIAAGGLLAVALAASGRGGGATSVLPVATGAAAFVVCEWWLRRAVARRRARIQDELPSVLDFLALSLAAGESLTDAIRRCSRVGNGALSEELRTVMVAVGTGSPLPTALAAFATRITAPGVPRAVDQLVAAIERGSPVAQVLRDQAADARDEHKRAMLEQAGKKEIAMLLPLVFLILPLSVLIAVFPGIQLLGLAH